MKLSQFTIILVNYPRAGQHLTYNTITRSLVGINDECLSVLRSLKEREPPASAGPVLQRLQAQGMVVQVEQDEAHLFNQIFSSQRSWSKELHATILTTLDCPMDCAYCYQKHIRGSGRMSAKTMEKAVYWLEEQTRSGEVERCFITFYGGEPLMNMAPIELIGKRMRQYCRGEGIKLSLAMVTSGILLTPKVADRLKSIGVRHLQITLDGDRETHDRRRPIKDGRGTFDLIMGHLGHLTEDFYVTILCNVDRTNTEAAYSLVDILISHGYAGKLRNLIFGPVSEAFESARSQHAACPGTSDKDLILLSVYAAEHGFSQDLRPVHSICGMLLSSRFVIDPDGRLYMCPSFLGRDEYRAGSIDQHSNIGFHELMNFSLSEECLKCPYAPICAGGCRYNALVEMGDIKAVSCQKEMFSYSLPLLLKAHHALRSKRVQDPELDKDGIVSERAP